MKKCRIGFCEVFLAVVSVVVFSSNLAYAYDGPWPKIFDSTATPDHYNTTYSPGMDQYGFFDSSDPLRSQITPVPKPGAYRDWDNYRYTTLYDRALEEGRPVGVYLQCFTYPLGNNLYEENKAPDALLNTMDYLSGLSNGRLDYVFMEFEPCYENIENANAAEAVRQVRAHTDSRINQAKLGCYDYFPCNEVTWKQYPSLNSAENLQTFNNAYSSSGLNVAMPSLYPLEYYEVHASSYSWGSNVSPNERSALFWAPLEKLSQVKKALPAGHELIPWVNDVVQSLNNGYSTNPPEKEDNAALLQHVRLRGADGYYGFRTMACEMDDGSPLTGDYYAAMYDTDEYRYDMLVAWTALDWLFRGVDKEGVEILNLETSKTTGFEWSAMETDNGVAVLLSNLGNYGRYFYFSALTGAGMDAKYLPDLNDGQSYIYVPAGDHVLLTVPEPATLSLLAFGSLLLQKRLRKKQFMEIPS